MQILCRKFVISGVTSLITDNECATSGKWLDIILKKTSHEITAFNKGQKKGAAPL